MWFNVGLKVVVMGSHPVKVVNLTCDRHSVDEKEFCRCVNNNYNFTVEKLNGMWRALYHIYVYIYAFKSGLSGKRVQAQLHI